MSYLLIAAFVTSLFDVVDVNDICLGDKAVFSTTDTAANNPEEGDDNLQKLFGMNAAEFLCCCRQPWNKVIEERSCAAAEEFNLRLPWRVKLNNFGRQLLQNLNLW